MKKHNIDFYMADCIPEYQRKIIANIKEVMENIAYLRQSKGNENLPIMKKYQSEFTWLKGLLTQEIRGKKPCKQ